MQKASSMIWTMLLISLPTMITITLSVPPRIIFCEFLIQFYLNSGKIFLVCLGGELGFFLGGVVKGFKKVSGNIWKTKQYKLFSAQSAAAVEYTDCISAEGKNHLPTSVVDMTLYDLRVSLWSWSLRECGVPLYCHWSPVHSNPEGPIYWPKRTIWYLNLC